MRDNHHPVTPTGDRCPRCKQKYDFWTKDGKLIGPFHPMGKCKEPNAIRVVVPTVFCEVCGTEVSASRPGAGKTRTCSKECRQILDAKERTARRLRAELAAKQRSEEAKAFYAARREEREQKAQTDKRRKRAANE